jgi:membrane-associated phospholipid phosphatase
MTCNRNTSPAQPFPGISPRLAPRPWHSQIVSRIVAYWHLKAIGTTAFMTGFFFIYLYLLKNPIRPVSVMPLTILDNWIGFRPEALPLYFSLWFYVSLTPALLDTKRQLYSYLLHVGGLCLAGLACFLAWPTAIPATDLAWHGYPGFSLLKGIDNAGNACPSLHVATAVFSGIWLGRLLSETDSPRLLRALNWVWCCGIVYSTLAVKQHVVVDVLAGGLLGVAVAALSLAMRPTGSSIVIAQP